LIGAVAIGVIMLGAQQIREVKRQRDEQAALRLLKR